MLTSKSSCGKIETYEDFLRPRPLSRPSPPAPSVERPFLSFQREVDAHERPGALPTLSSFFQVLTSDIRPSPFNRDLGQIKRASFKSEITIEQFYLLHQDNQKSSEHNCYLSIDQPNMSQCDLYKTGRFSPASVVQDPYERGSPPRYLSNDHSRCYSQSTDSMDSFASIAHQEHKCQSSPSSTPGKCRLLPCRTFISTGSCCYGDRCVFLHDQGVVSKPVYVKYLVRILCIFLMRMISLMYLCQQKKSKEDTSPDSFFWPMMPAQLVKNKLDNRNRKCRNMQFYGKYN